MRPASGVMRLYYGLKMRPFYRDGRIGRGSDFMKTFARSRIGLAAAMGLLVACATSNKEVSQAPRSDDLLELLTGFGESLSKRNFTKAVDYMVPEEKALMLEGGVVPPEKQKMLMALPLQRLIRSPAVRVENGHIAGIYGLLPNLKQGEATANMASNESSGVPDSSSPSAAAAPQGPMASEAAVAPSQEDDMAASMAASAGNPNDPQLKSAVNKFFSAVNRKNWSGALAMINENERKLLLDDKGRLKESSKHRLAQIDQKNREALTLQDGKLTGVTLLLPSAD
jgi:hypothetical protein